MSKERETSRLVSNQTGVAVTISGDPVILGVGNTELVRVTGNGNIGIGTDDPSVASKLHVVNGDIRLSGWSEHVLKIRHNDSGNDSNISQLSDGSLRIRYGSDERLRITSSGNVGIGSDTPATLINGQASTAELRLRSTGASNGALVSFVPGTQTNPYYIWVNPSRELIFQDNTSERLRIKSDGKVGISQDDPNATLHIGGDAAAHGDITNPAFQIGGTSSYRFGIFSENESATIACPNGDNGIKISVKTAGVIAQFTPSAWDTGGTSAAGIILGSDSEHVVGYANTITMTPYVGDVTFIRGRNIELYTFDGIFYRTGTGGLDWQRWYASSTNVMNLTSDGYLLIGYTSSNGAYKLQVNSQIFATSSTIATSDQRYKENIQSLDGCYDIVKQLNPVSFTWKNDENIYHPTKTTSYEEEILDDDGNKTGTFETITTPKLLRESHNFPSGTQVGFIAQEVQSTLSDKSWLNSIIKSNTRPQVLDDDGTELLAEETFYGIAEGNMISILTSALKESITKIEELQAKVTALESHVGIAST